mmetsp:Transcript_146021/g.406815  ORF Transcript_146021/g.406815 Transcript_146021/m.406815 type:complete len:220 (-) Transcript_146021:190-849(-)
MWPWPSHPPRRPRPGRRGRCVFLPSPGSRTPTNVRKPPSPASSSLLTVPPPSPPQARSLPPDARPPSGSRPGRAPTAVPHASARPARWRRQLLHLQIGRAATSAATQRARQVRRQRATQPACRQASMRLAKRPSDCGPVPARAGGPHHPARPTPPRGGKASRHRRPGPGRGCGSRQSTGAPAQLRCARNSMHPRGCCPAMAGASARPKTTRWAPRGPLG